MTIKVYSNSEGSRIDCIATHPSLHEEAIDNSGFIPLLAIAMNMNIKLFYLHFPDSKKCFSMTEIDSIDLRSLSNYDVSKAGSISNMKSTFSSTAIAWNICLRNKVASSTSTGYIQLLDVETKQMLGTIKPSGIDIFSHTANLLGITSLLNEGAPEISNNRNISQFKLNGNYKNVIHPAADDRAVNKLGWNYFNSNIIAAAYQGGSVKIFDTRQPLNENNAQLALFNPHADACRDLSFSPFREHEISMIFDNGFWFRWDYRYPDIRDALKVLGHTSHGSAIAYHPFNESLIGTASRDKTVKLWDLSKLEKHFDGVVKPEVVIHTSNPISKIAWCPRKAEDINSNFIATSSSDRGEISIWNCSDNKSAVIPECILHGAAENCTDFNWFLSDSIENDFILTSTKEGMMNAQQISSSGHFPRSQIAPLVASVSSQGHVALQRGVINRETSKLLPKSIEDQSKIDTSIRIDDEDTGSIYFGKGDIKTLDRAFEIRFMKNENFTAEGGVFDPAMIGLLAQNYQTGWENTSSMNPASKSHAEMACENNRMIALKVGLQCRATVWSTVLALLQSISTPSIKVDSTKSDHSSMLPFTVELLASLLKELLEGGDCLHFVYLCEVLRCASCLDIICSLPTSTITKQRRDESYAALVNLLTKQQLFITTTSLMKSSRNEDILSRLQLSGITFHIACSKCSKEIPSNSRSTWCVKCSQSSSLCSLCHRPVKGLLQWCPCCGHGGHKRCMLHWFQNVSSHCPAGCEHMCYFKEAEKSSQ